MVERVILDVINVFESGRPGVINALAVIPGDAGGLSIGKCQASLFSGNAGALLRHYQQIGGKLFPEEMLQRFDKKDPSLNSDSTFRTYWRLACGDPLMEQAQNEFFINKFVAPAEKWCAAHDFTEPLTILTVADSMVHGSFTGGANIAGRVPPGLNQWDWTRQYLAIRKQWLSTHKNPVLQRTVYRVNALLALIKDNNWKLDTPLTLQLLHADGSLERVEIACHEA